MTGHAEIFHWGYAEPDTLPVGSVYCHQCAGWYKPQPVDHELIHHRADYQSAPSHTVPQTHMSTEDSGALVHLLTRLPSNTGFIISHMIEPPHTPGVWGGYHAKVILPNGGRGEANHNNPALAFREAWAKAHESAAEMLMPKEGK